MNTPIPHLDFADASELSDDALRAWARLIVHVVQKRGQAESESHRESASQPVPTHKQEQSVGWNQDE